MLRALLFALHRASFTYLYYAPYAPSASDDPYAPRAPYAPYAPHILRDAQAAKNNYSSKTLNLSTYMHTNSARF